MLSEAHGALLIQLARHTIEEQLEAAHSNPLNENELQAEALQAECGVFVTLNKRNALRGCIGSLAAMESIVEGVKRHAINAAFHDNRFPPLQKDEISQLCINVSVLSVPQELEYEKSEDLPHLLKPGIDGVIISSPNGVGSTFLPQVWKQLPDAVSFLEHLCQKAGLSKTAWLQGDLQVQIYQVQYFEEDMG